MVQVSGEITASGKHQRHLIHVAPAPILAGLEGPDHGMVSAVKVLGGMTVRRRIEASHVSAGEAQPQMEAHGSPVFRHSVTTAVCAIRT